MNNIAFLPPDVIRHVMGFTYDTTLIARRVCKQWELALSDRALIDNHGLETVNIRKHKYILSMFGIRTKNIIMEKWRLKEIFKPMPYCPNLTYLNVSYYSDNEIMEMVKGYPKLEYLLVWSSILTDTSIVEVARRCPMLTHIAVHGCSKLTDIAIIAVARGCPNITYFDVSQCGNLTDISMIAVARGCPNLTELIADNCGYFTDTSMVEIAHGCPMLTRLEICKCSDITDASLIALAQRCPKLEVLDIFDCNMITDNAIVAVAQMCPNLTYLEVSNCWNLTDIAITAVAHGCPKIATFFANECSNLTDNAIIDVVRRCPMLKKIDMGSCKISINNTNTIMDVEKSSKLTIIILREISCRYPKLKEIHFDWYYNKIPKQIKKLFPGVKIY
jgi:hypothetical protein